MAGPVEKGRDRESRVRWKNGELAKLEARGFFGVARVVYENGIPRRILTEESHEPPPPGSSPSG